MPPTFPSRRSVVMAQNGIVATGQPLAALAGLDILKAGGNAADAAVATAAMLNVVEPMSTGIGGDMFAIVYDGKSGASAALTAAGDRPMPLRIDAMRAARPQDHPTARILACHRPGRCGRLERSAGSAWHDEPGPGAGAGDRLCSRRLPCLRDHRRLLAAGGAEAGRRSRGGRHLPARRQIATAGPDRPPARPGAHPGDRSPRAAQTPSTAARSPAAIVEHSRQNGGLFDLADFADHTSTWVEPISIDLPRRRSLRMPAQRAGAGRAAGPEHAAGR